MTPNQFVNKVINGVGNAWIVLQFKDMSLRSSKRSLILVFLTVIVSYLLYLSYDILKRDRIENRLRDSIQSINQVDLYKIRIDIIEKLNSLDIDANFDDNVINKKAYMTITPLLVEIDADISTNTTLINNSEIAYSGIKELSEINDKLKKARGAIENLIEDLVKTYKENKVVKNNGTGILQYY